MLSLFFLKIIGAKRKKPHRFLWDLSKASCHTTKTTATPSSISISIKNAHTYTRARTHTQPHKHIHTHLHSHTYSHLHTHSHIYTHTHTHTHTCTHTHLLSHNLSELVRDISVRPKNGFSEKMRQFFYFFHASTEAGWFLFHSCYY